MSEQHDARGTTTSKDDYDWSNSSYDLFILAVTLISPASLSSVY